MPRNTQKDIRAEALRRERILMAGLRLFSQQGIERVSMNMVAQAAGVAALRETAYAEKLRALLAQQRPWLKQQLERLGCFVLPGEANYLLFRSPDPKLGQRLERQGVLIRACADYDGLGPNWFRVAVRTAAENQRLIETMEGLL